MALADLHCAGYGPDARALTPTEIVELQPQAAAWSIIEHAGSPRLERTFKFRTFVQSLAFTNAVGEMAEVENHHPAILTEWGRVTVQWWTHHVGGLHLNDFIAAAKTDRIYDGAEHS